jgi:hypothetical protein
MSDRDIWWVKDYLTYKDGHLYWIKCDAPWVDITQPAGHIRKDGYLAIGFKGKNYLGHQLIWFLCYREVADLLDHIDRNPSNNRIENLRRADKRLNSLNRDAPSNSKSGKAGVSWDSARNKWTVRWKETSGKYSFLGYFEDLNTAIEVRTRKEQEVLGDGK